MSKSQRLSNQQKFHFKWYQALILVGIIAIVGISVLYFSQASSLSYYGPTTMTGGKPTYGSDAQTIVSRSLATAIPVSFSQELPTNTIQTLCVQLTGIPEGGTKLYTSTSVTTSKGGGGGSSDQYVATNGWVQLYQDNWALSFAEDGPTAKMSTVIAGSDGTNKPVPNPSVEVVQFAITQGGTPCPTN